MEMHVISCQYIPTSFSLVEGSMVLILWVAKLLYINMVCFVKYFNSYCLVKFYNCQYLFEKNEESVVLLME